MCVCSEMRSGATLLSGLRVGKSRRLKHHGERGPRLVAATQRIAAELEATPKRGQLEKSGMASRAGLPGLPCVQGKRDGTPWRQTDNGHCDDRCAADQNGKQYLAIAALSNLQNPRKPSDHANVPLSVSVWTTPKKRITRLLTTTTRQPRIYSVVRSLSPFEISALIAASTAGSARISGKNPAG
jgi:hypothetical protein